MSRTPVAPGKDQWPKPPTRTLAATGAGGGVVWGGITGTLSAQTDLQSALNLKANLASPTFTGTVSGITATMVGAPSGSGTSTGTNTGDQTSVSGNAGTVTTINGRISAGTNVSITGSGTAGSPYVINSSGGGAASWGSITGTLSAQTDLNSALALKATLASPTFTGTVTLPAGTVVNGVTLTTGGGTSNFLRADGTYAAPPTGVAWGAITGTLSSQTDLNSALGGKQATLVSGTNIKTINGSTILGSGDLVVSSGSNIDGGSAASVYGGATVINGGGA